MITTTAFRALGSLSPSILCAGASAASRVLFMSSAPRALSQQSRRCYMSHAASSSARQQSRFRYARTPAAFLPTPGFPSALRTFSSSPQEQEIVGHLAKIMHPEKEKDDIVFLGLIKGATFENGTATITLDLDKSYRKIKQEILDSLSGVPWIDNVQVKMYQPPLNTEGGGATDGTPNKPALENVRSIIAVSSCKGGVGKSTVSVNLAYGLAQQGYKVGLFDADVYGPSLPTMISPRDSTLRQNAAGKVAPIIYKGVKTMSYGYVPQPKNDSSAILRGPMVSSIVQQLVFYTDWGSLDYLVVDMPPGTGDIQLTLCQQLQITSSVVVTTPQKLSFVDVVKGIDMFSKLKVPVVGVVENLAYFTCDNCDKRHEPFGPSLLEKLATTYGIRNSYQFPVLPEISYQGDHGEPVMNVQTPETQIVRDLYTEIAKTVDAETRNIHIGNVELPTVNYDIKSNKVHVKIATGEKYEIDPEELRGACQCAKCVDEFTGEPLLTEVKPDVKPLRVDTKGNYAVAISWDDGHDSSIYPYDRLIEMSKPL